MKFFVGLILGIAIAAGVAFYLNKAQNPFVDKGFTNQTASATIAANNKTSSSAPLLLAPGTKMQAAASAPAVKPAASTPSNYDFYDVLQGKKAIATKPVASDTATSTPEQHGYLVQAGAFSDPDLANNMKAKLALLGFNAKIEAEQGSEKIINKVVLGPFAEQAQAAELVNQLRQQQISATIVNLN